MGTHPIFESDFDCLTDSFSVNATEHIGKNREIIMLCHEFT